MSRKAKAAPSPGVAMTEGWASYREKVFPPTAPEVQVTECKLAFYAGGLTMFNALNHRFAAGVNMSADDIREVQGALKELRQFYEQVVKKIGTAGTA